jgi:uracil-DNA glycosylase family 4
VSLRQRRPRRHPLTLATVRSSIIGCDRCPRLRAYCKDVALVKKAAHRDDVYWAKPVPGFGDAEARVLILGLAPAAHGANRTGRVFTGDGAGASGDFLMAALNRAGLANIPTSQHVDDGLVLTGIYIAAAVRCAPPQNKPTPREIAACLDHLEAEVSMLPHVEVVVALGRIAWDAWLMLWARHGCAPRPKPVFGHGALVQVPASVQSSKFKVQRLVGCFHPSRQNTNTGKVTPKMYDAIFGRQIPRLLDSL